MSHTERPNLYVGCSLTLATEDFKARVESLKGRLRDNWEVMEFLGLVAGTEKDVYEQDIIRNVGGCDAFVGVCDEPAIGLGWELCEATKLGKPTLAVAHVDSKVSRLIKGAHYFHPNIRFRQYEDMIKDVPPIVLEEFEVVRNSVVVPRLVAEV